MFSQIRMIFGSRMKALEILSLLNNTKEVVRQGFYAQELEAVESFCKVNNLFIEKSRFRVEIDDAEHFTNRGKIADDGMVFVYISKDELKAAQACLAETVGDHHTLGLMLGYPECCVTFFCGQFPGNTNPVHSPTNMWTNLTQRKNDICLLSHFPCSSDCEKSIAIAQKNFELLDETERNKWVEKLSIIA